MFGGLFGLSIRQKVYLHLSLASPSIVALVTMFTMHSWLNTLAIYLAVSTLILPFIYIRFLSKERETKAYLINEFRQRGKQVDVGLKCLLGAFVIVFLMYFFIYEFRHAFLEKLQLPIRYNYPYLIGIGLLMAIAVPIAEEWFWRTFAIKSFPESDTNKKLIAGYYAFYHWVMFMFMMDWKAATLLVGTFYSMAVTMDYVRNKYGLITAWLLHIGINTSLTLVFLDVVVGRMEMMKSHSDIPKYLKINKPL